MWYQLQRHPHEGAAAETVAHQADEEDETAMEGTRATSEFADCSRVGGYIEWRTHITELGVRHACEDEGAMLITSGWQLNKITCSACQLTTHSL